MVGENAETLTILRQKFNSIPYFDKDLMNAQTFVNYNEILLALLVSNVPPHPSLPVNLYPLTKILGNRCKARLN